MGKPKEPPAFEDALEELETIVERMEDGEPSLEESLQLFERGMGLTRRCQKALDDAEQRIRTFAESESSSEIGEIGEVGEIGEDSTSDG